jgi:hypothetical protein
LEGIGTKGTRRRNGRARKPEQVQLMSEESQAAPRSIGGERQQVELWRFGNGRK